MHTDIDNSNFNTRSTISKVTKKYVWILDFATEIDLLKYSLRMRENKDQENSKYRHFTAVTYFV